MVRGRGWQLFFVGHLETPRAFAKPPASPRLTKLEVVRECLVLYSGGGSRPVESLRIASGKQVELLAFLRSVVREDQLAVLKGLVVRLVAMYVWICLM